MKKVVFLFVLLLTVSFYGQRAQRIAYIDMDYILDNVPEYLDAQNALDQKVAGWKKNLDKQARHIEVLKTDLANEKAILTKDIIDEREEEITLKQEELRRLESLYFGPNGDMYQLRKKFVQPVQDQVYNAIQDIASRKRYDFVFDKSSELVMLYSNKKHDISELVLKAIDRTRKVNDRKGKKGQPKELSEKQKQAIAKKEAIQAKKEADKLAQKKAIEDKRKARLKEREAKRELLRKKKEELRKKKEEEKKKEDNKENNK